VTEEPEWPDDMPKPESDDDPKQAEDRFPSLDWEEEFARDYSVIDWLPGKFMERGQQISLVGGGKVGKSLFMHHWVWSVAAGKPFLGDTAREPLNVLYFDKENSRRDIVARLRSLGATPADLKRVEYKSFPAFSGAFDQSVIAIAEFHDIVEKAAPDIVVLDTVSRFIAGKENDSDTWLALNRLIQEPLKKKLISYIRLDHFGKDESKGARGSSAKEGDIDHIWELVELADPEIVANETGEIETVTTQLKLARTHTRTGLGRGEILITRVGQKECDGPWFPGRTRQYLTTGSADMKATRAVEAVVDQLIALGVPKGLGRDRLTEWAKAHGVEMPGRKQTRQDITSALKARHAHS